MRGIAGVAALYKGVKAREMLMEAIEDNLRKLQDLPDDARLAITVLCWNK